MLGCAKAMPLCIAMWLSPHTRDWTKDLENLERVSPSQFGGNQDELHQRACERVMSRTFERQVNELHIRAAILNRFTEMGRPQTTAVA